MPGRAAHLCKADLVSNAVVEFTSQQGVMGGYYAIAMGENEEVAHAIRDHYRPRFAGDELPEGTAGCIVACADKLDTIAGIFAIGEPPTGSSDPYALRRAAIGIINILARPVCRSTPRRSSTLRSSSIASRALSSTPPRSPSRFATSSTAVW